MIELKNIKKYYKMGDNIVKALDDINLTINDGEFVTIIGPSGSGKSTMMNIVGCLDKSTSGNYYVDGVEISKYSENQLAFLRNKKMGFIFQGFNLLQNLSAYENVELPLIYQGISKSERKKRVTESLAMVGMQLRMNHKPSELSGGQQQRVAIARALATKPMCILADEPTGNLDSKTGDEIMKILKDLNDNGTTVIIITHNDEIARLSKRVVRIHDGKIYSDEINENILSYGTFVNGNEWELNEKSTASVDENLPTEQINDNVENTPENINDEAKNELKKFDESIESEVNTDEPIESEVNNKTIENTINDECLKNATNEKLEISQNNSSNEFNNINNKLDNISEKLTTIGGILENINLDILNTRTQECITSENPKECIINENTDNLKNNVVCDFVDDGCKFDNAKKYDFNFFVGKIFSVKKEDK